MNAFIIVQTVLLIVLLALLVLKGDQPDWRLGVTRALVLWALFSAVYIVTRFFAPGTG